MKHALAAAFALAVSVCLPAALANAQTVLERGNGADPVTLDPQRATSAAEMAILRDLYEGLVTYDADGSIIPGAAESWTVSPDGLTWTFTLRDAQWSDGSDVTAEDFVRAFQRLVTPATAAPDAAMFTTISNAFAILAGEIEADQLGVTALDDGTIQIVLDRPDPLLIHALALPAAMPVHREGNGIRDIPSVTDPFNGAYRFDGFSPGEGLWLIRNDDFHAAADVAYDTVVYRGLSADIALDAYNDGELAITGEVPAFAVGDLVAADAPGLRFARFAGTYMLAANVDGELADAGLRRAVALAIDRVALAEGVWRGLMIADLAIVPEGVADLGGPAEAPLGANDAEARIAEAEALLAAAGYGPDNPLILTLAIPASDLSRATGESIAADLAAIGIELRINERIADTHGERLLSERDFDLATVGWVSRLGHVDEFLALFEEGELNVTGYNDPAVNSWLTEARATTDRTVRTALYAAADREIAAAMPAIALMHFASVHLVSPGITGWADNVIDVHLSRWLAPVAAAAEAGAAGAQDE